MNRPQALVIAYTVPQNDRDSGSLRVLDVVEMLRSAGWSVSFVAANSSGDPRYGRALQQRGVAVLNGTADELDAVVESGRFDLAILAFWPVAERFLPIIRELSPRTRILVDSIDVHFIREARGTFQDGPIGSPSRWLDQEFGARLVREVNTYAAADGVLAVSQKEADLINDLVGDPDLAHVVPLGQKLEPSSVPLAERAGIAFVGSFQHPPNIQAVEYLCREILPRMNPRTALRHPVYIVGNALNEDVRSLGDGLPNVRMVGWVPSIVPYLARARVSVVPLLYGAGVKGKLVQAMMVGTPSVSTSMGVEGLAVRHAEHVLVADDPAAFADSIDRLLMDDHLWQELSRKGREFIVSTNGQETVLNRFTALIQRVMAEPRDSRPPLATPPGRSEATPMNPRRYAQLVRRVREAVARSVPSNATILVISKGDEELLDLEGRTGWHFPRAANGTYLGHYPANSAAAIAHLESLRQQGAEYLVVPDTSRWWLSHYEQFGAYVNEWYEQVFHEDRVCAVYAARMSLNGKIGPAAGQRLERCEGPNGTGKGDDSVDRVKLIAFYLPQFHPIPENDRWWGRGFTEWTNVSKVRPLFPGHNQPRLPADLGYYDLRLPESRLSQARLAREFGIHGFCYYHFWFSGKRLLERPFEQVLRSGEPDFPFCLCWANEPWSRRWDGSESDVLQPQSYSPQDDLDHIHWLLDALADPRAITLEDRPIFLVYRADQLPDPARTTDLWRREVERAGLKDLYLIAVETGWDAGWDATRVGFDAKVLFQPQFSILGSIDRIDVSNPRLRVYDYQRAWPVLANPQPVSYIRYDTVFPSWDNTPRKGNEGWVVHNSTPEAYEKWLRWAVERAMTRPAAQRAVFLNAWNEWAEGAYLEPDRLHGRAFLEATRRAFMASGITSIAPISTSLARTRRGIERTDLASRRDCMTSYTASCRE